MSSSPAAPAIRVSNLSKRFGAHAALVDVDLEVHPGEMVALIGPSGSGKSTLLRHLSGLVAGDRSRGSVQVLGTTVQHDGRISRRVRAVRAQVGFIFQQFHLVGRLSLLENVLVGALSRTPAWRSLIRWFPRADRLQGMEALARVGLAHQAGQRASTLSGGQQQRAAIARAMLQRARVILADEPIASLDPESARLVMDGLQQLNRESGVTVLVSLHQVQFAMQYCRRTVALRQGRVVFDGLSAQLAARELHRIYGGRLDEPDGGGTASLAAAGPLRGALTVSLSQAGADL